MPSDYTVIFKNGKHFGNERSFLSNVEPNAEFVGPNGDFSFPCPGVNPRERSVLMFQSRDVDHQKNVFKVNGVSITGRIPESPNKDTWNGNVMIIEPNVLRATNNFLRVESRNTNGDGGGDIDDFILDNMVIVYKAQ
jgi:hypothetical protein